MQTRANIETRALYILPCPFCGCKDIDVRKENVCAGHGDYRDKVYIYCPECSARVYASDYANNTAAVESAVERWNTRNGILWVQPKEKPCLS